MDAAETMAERHGRMLARVAELSLALAEDVQATALAAGEADDKAKLAVAFQRMARSVRQCIALEARLVRDQSRDAREARTEAAAGAAAVVETRKRQVRADVERRIVCEVDPREAEAWLADLDERLEEEALYDNFLDEPVEAHIARLAENLGLTGEALRDYIPRACRPRGGPLSRDHAAILEHLLGDDKDEEDEEDEDDEEQDDAEEADGPQGRDADGGSDCAGTTSPDTPPIGHSAESALGPADGRTRGASGRLSPQAEEAQSDPDPPPKPPDPPPYVPPWERLAPGDRFPGGSGY